MLSLGLFWSLTVIVSFVNTNLEVQIVIGGGTAGLAVATRLSQGLRQACVLVVEAGPDAHNESKIYIPGLKGSTIGTAYDWNFTTIPQPDALDRVWTQARGKVLGGSSALNLMTYDRGCREDYDAWEQLGSPGWNWKALYPSMLKAENFTRNASTYGTAGVGYGGPIQAAINDFIPFQQLSFIPTLNVLGVPSNLESLDGNPLGVMWQPSSIRSTNYTRSYSPDYLPLAGSNLVVSTNTRVAKINFDRLGNGSLVATGITLTDNSTITASKEVILSAGSFQSPNLLELSGIGNSSIITSAGVQPLLDLPGVGENLQDHIRIQNSYQLKPNYTSFDELRFNATFAATQLVLYNANQRSEYDYTGSGYSFLTWDQVQGAATQNLTSLAQQAATADSNSSISQKKLNYLVNPTLKAQVPQLEIIFSDGYTGVKGYPPVNTTLYGQGFFTLIAAILHPFSRGSVHINSSNPIAKPVINPNYLSHEYDIQAAITATQYLRKVANTAPLKDIWVSEYEPGTQVQTDAQWRTFAQNTTLTIYHPAGTCALLPKADGGVVDPNLKVYGTTNLRVVDASVIPILPSAHLQTVVYGIAEQAAEIIVKIWAELD